MTGDRPGQLRWLARVRADAVDADAVARAQAELDAALAALAPADLERAASELGRFVPAASVRLRQAELAFEQGDAAHAQELLARAQELPLAGPDAERMTALEARLRGEAPPGAGPSAFPSAAQVHGTLGVVLPLSGELASAGDEALEGVLLASGVLEAPEARGPRRARAGPAAPRARLGRLAGARGRGGAGARRRSRGRRDRRAPHAARGAGRGSRRRRPRRPPRDLHPLRERGDRAPERLPHRDHARRRDGAPGRVRGDGARPAPDRDPAPAGRLRPEHARALRERGRRARGARSWPRRAIPPRRSTSRARCAS